jgi:CheY-like chemotaxis protein
MARVWMVVEDDPIIRSILSALMTLWDIEALALEDGDEAWAWLDEVERGTYSKPLPDIALLDIRMPGYPGYEIGRRMRAIPATASIPLIIMTAFMLSDADKAFIQEAARPEHLIIKPLPPPDDLRALIEQTIEGSSAKTEPVSSRDVRERLSASIARRAGLRGTD